MNLWGSYFASTTPTMRSTVTQFVVGAVGDTDLELLSLTDGLHRHLGLTRTYFSAFHAVIQTPLENVAPTDSMRDYGWEVEDLPFSEGGNLPTSVDPKKAYAEAHLREAPIDVMTADRADLLRIPNVDPKGADVILKARAQGKLTELADLRKVGIAAPENAAPYILFNGKRPPIQERLF